MLWLVCMIIRRHLLLSHSNFAVSMIGKNGLVIKELQSQSGAFINMAKEGDVYRIARISGNYPETHLCALLLVQKFTSREDAPKHDKLDALIRFYKKSRTMVGRWMSHAVVCVCNYIIYMCVKIYIYMY